MPFADPSWSLDAVIYLQHWSPHPVLDTLVLAITLLGDPKNIFLWLAPLVYWLCHRDRLLALNIIVGLVSTDWLNALLKWPLRGDRPYWHDDRVKEFTVTCESGYGMPSGHGEWTSLLDEIC
jgi:membrane-associated phospholipid phosphatase